MALLIGIRKEDKDPRERRASLILADIIDLREARRLRFLVRPPPLCAGTGGEVRDADGAPPEDPGEASIVPEITPAAIGADRILTERFRAPNTSCEERTTAF